MTSPRLTWQTIKILIALYREPGMAGADICRSTSFASGTVYPILTRLEEAGWVTSRWEAESPESLGRPRRREYTLTAVGAAKATEAERDVTQLAWRPA